MKAEIRSDGYIWISADSPAEAFALKYITQQGECCLKCGQVPTPIVFDTKVEEITM